jgi:flagellar hook-associated protein 3 FlgL
MIFALSNASIQQARSDSVDAQAEVSSGKKLTHPWEGSGDAGLITQQSLEQSRQDAISKAATSAGNELQAADGAFNSVVTTLQRAQELATQLGNDTYSPAQRAAASTEAQGLLTSLVSQVNYQYGGRYVFGGTKDSTPPFDATGNYLGDTNVRQVESAPGVLQNASIRADQAFKGVGGGVDVLTEVQNLVTALSTNNGAGIRATVQSLGDGIKQVSSFRSQAGTMANVFDMAKAAATSSSDAATKAQSNLSDADIFAASTRLSATQTALQASISAASKQFSLSLLDKL